MEFRTRLANAARPRSLQSTQQPIHKVTAAASLPASPYTSLYTTNSRPDALRRIRLPPPSSPADSSPSQSATDTSPLAQRSPSPERRPVATPERLLQLRQRQVPTEPPVVHQSLAVLPQAVAPSLGEQIRLSRGRAAAGTAAAGCYERPGGSSCRLIDLSCCTLALSSTLLVT